MKKRLTAVLYYALFWLVFFFAARLFFIITHFQESSHYGFGAIAATFIHGIRLDISATGYIFLLPLLLMIPGVYFNGSWFRIFIKWYTYIIIIISSCIIIPDTLLYKYWGFRMDYTVLFYLKTPKEAAASVTPFQMVFIIAGVILFSSLFIFIYNRFIKKLFSGFNRIKLWYVAMLFFALLWGSMIIPIRGGTGIAPINAGSVYFSKDMFVNHTAVNVVWNVGSSVINRKPTKNPYEFGDLSYAAETVKSLTRDPGSTLKILNNTRPNIIVIVLESFGSILLVRLEEIPLPLQTLTGTSREGVLFSQIFIPRATEQIRRCRRYWMVILLNPHNSIMKEPEKSTISYQYC